MRIGKLIKDSDKPFFSLEFFPPAEKKQMAGFFKVVNELGELGPLFVSVTYGAGGKKQQNTLEVTAELARRDFATMAHLTCVNSEPEKIRDFLRQLDKAGIQNVLALRGDAPVNSAWDWTATPFAHASDLVKFIKEEMPAMGIGVAAYPCPHPESPNFAQDREYTAKKMASGADFAISQLFFDVREYLDLVQSLRERGIDAPVVPGILPIQSFDSLRKVLSLCGANIPGKLYLELEAANESGGAEAVREAGLRFALNQIGQLLDAGAPGIHLYTLNKSGLCKRIIQESGLRSAR